MMTSFWLIGFFFLSFYCTLCVNVQLSLVINNNYTVSFNTNTYKTFLKTICNASTEEFSADINNELEVENIHQIALTTERPKSQLGFNYLCVTRIYKATVPISLMCIRKDTSEPECLNCYAFHLKDPTLCEMDCVGIMWSGYSNFSVIHDNTVFIQRGLCGYQTSTVSVRENASSDREILSTPKATTATVKELQTAQTASTTKIPATSGTYSTLFQTKKKETTFKILTMPVKDKSTTSLISKYISTTAVPGKVATPFTGISSTSLSDKSSTSLSGTSTTRIADKTTTSLPGSSAASLTEKSTTSLQYKTTGSERGKSTTTFTGILTTPPIGKLTTSLTGKSTTSQVSKPTTSLTDKLTIPITGKSTSSVINKSTFGISRSTTPIITTTTKDLKILSSTTEQTTRTLLTTSVSKTPLVPTTEKEVTNTIPLKSDPTATTVPSTTPRLRTYSVKRTTTSTVLGKTTVEIKGNNHVKETNDWELTPLGVGLISGLCAAIVIIVVIFILLYKLRLLMPMKKSREVTARKQINPPPPAPSTTGKKCVRFQIEERENVSQWWL